MSQWTAVALGAVAGATIFLGLPVARMRGLPKPVQGFLNAFATGILVFLLWDILTHAAGPVEVAVGQGHAGPFVAMAAIFAAGIAAGLPGHVDGIPGQLGLLLDRFPGGRRRGASVRAERAVQPWPPDQHPDPLRVGAAGGILDRLRHRPVPDRRQRNLGSYDVQLVVLGIEVMPIGIAPPEKALLDLEHAVQHVLDLGAVPQRLGDVDRHRLYHLADLDTDSLRHRADAVPIHLLEAPEHPVGGPQHPLEGVPAALLPPADPLLLLDAAVGVVNHGQLPFLAYRLP